MFEAHVLYLLRRYLGEYVRGLSAEALRISVWQGDVVLKDLQLKAEALNALRLPIVVKAGFIGSVTLKVPWNRLGKDPVIVLLDRIFILAEPLKDDLFTEDKKSWLDAKRRQIEEAELAMLEAKDKRNSLQETSPETSSWLGSLIATIVGNLKISVTNLHLRYEDTVSNSSHPFCFGITLGKLAAVTIDEKGMETFVTSGAFDRLQKSLQLQHFAVYHDSDTYPWTLNKTWEEMTPQEWSEIFEPGISSAADQAGANSDDKHQYLLQPVGGIMKYYRYGKREKRDPEHPFQKASLVLDQVSLTLSEAQYRDGLKLLEGVSQYRTRMQFSKLRPQVSVANDPQSWWLYACQAVLQHQSRLWYRLSWEKVSRYCCLRRRYVQLYSSSLQQSSKVDNPEIQDMDEELSVEVILLWRLLAHAKVESSKVKEAALAREVARKKSWWTFGRSAEQTFTGAVGSEVSSDKSSLKQAIKEPSGSGGHFTKEEWNKLNELLSYQPGQESPLSSGQESQNMLQTALDVTIQHSAASIRNSKGFGILRGSFENLQIALDVYPKSLIWNVKLQFYGLSAPEGSLIESVSREGREDALVTTFVHSPLEENLDWKLALTMSACHVTVWRLSFDRFVEFFRTGQALSPDVALETAAALQSKLEEVTRKAQEQIQLVLKQQKRFSVDLDVDAPKLRIPSFTSKEGGETQLVLDLGHFKLHTSPDKDPQSTSMNMENLYSRFYFSGSDISASFVDGEFDWSKYSSLAPSTHSFCGDDPRDGACQNGNSQCAVFPILDRCGMLIIFDETRLQHPDYPSTRVIIEVPHLSLYFSPARYLRLLSLLKALEGRHEESEVNVGKISAWHQADFCGDARVLNWGGIGSTVAEWQPCWASLAGAYVYILDSEVAASYSRCCSVTNKQVLEVLPEYIGGSDFVIALCNRGSDMKKAIESSNTIVLQLRNADTKAAWIKHLTLAVYKASALVSLSLPAKLNAAEGVNDDQPVPANLSKQLDLFITGSLKELQVHLCGLTTVNRSLNNEVPILELQASGGQVDYLQRPFDMSIGMKLHALKVKDMLQGSVPSCQYMACSVLSINEDLTASIRKDEESEPFRDALPDFNALPSVVNIFGSDNSSSSFQTNEVLERKPLALSLDPTYLVRAGRAADAKSELEEVALDFINVLLFIRQMGSPDYDGTDTQMIINMATLDFFCNRRTVIALMDFGTDISNILDTQDASNSPVKPQSPELTAANAGLDSSERSVIKGLLGRGKSRVVFRLQMALKSARIYLNQEDGSQLAMLAQDKFHMDLSVYPGSFSISGTLGNLRVCDMFLGSNHHWGWLFDIRDPSCGSLVKLEFHSYNKEDDDYKGYDYSLFGKLSAVRIVFLYRFIQEVTAYFGALATPQVQEVITVFDKAGGIERLIQQADMDGAPAIKLNVSLDTPIIIMPRNSSSKEFMQLDLGRLEVYNIFEWHGGEKDDPSAIHLDILSAEITGINMFVGIEGTLGKAMIQEASGLHMKVYRPLRDLFKKVPEVQVVVQVESLCGIMSDKEYLVITDCAATNVSESPNFPPNFRDGLSSGPYDEGFTVVNQVELDTEEVGSDNGNSEGQAFSTWTKVWVTVDVKHSELELCTGDRDLSLARLQIQEFWLGYRSTSADEMDLYITVPKLSIFDERAGTNPEMKLMLGSMADVENAFSEDSVQVPISVSSDVNLTMLVMDLRMKPDSQAFVIRIQRPRLLVVVDFILSVAQFFVPSLSTLTGQDSTNMNEDPIVAFDHIRPMASYYQQKERVVTLSSNCRLIADAHDVNEFIYDGGGGSLYLNIKDNTPYSLLQPLIVVGYGKKLRFKNIEIKNGLRINECISLASNSSYSVSAEDSVALSNPRKDSEMLDTNQALSDSLVAISSGQVKSGGQPAKNPDLNFVLDVQVVAPEFTFYDSTKWPSKSFSREERLLRAKFDFNFMLAMKGNDRWMKAFLKGLTVEAGSGLPVVDPLDVSGEYVCAQDKTNFHGTVTEISVRLSFNVLRLMLRLHADAASKFQIGGVIALSQCTHFDRIWVDNSGNPLQQVAIWRPRAPPGFVILSDCATSGAAPPSQAVMAVSNSYFRVKKPVTFQLMWCSWGNLDGLEKAYPSGSSTDADVNMNICSIWLPIAPPGFVSVGCVAERGASPPPLSVVHCIRADLVTSASVMDCIFYGPPDERKHKQGCSIWRVENAIGSFYAHFSTELPPHDHLCDLREVLLQTFNVSRNEADGAHPEAESLSISRTNRKFNPGNSARSEKSRSLFSKSGRPLTTTVQFERLWWDKGNESRKAISLWRPLPPSGYAIIGDILVEGLEPPGVGVVLYDDGSERLTKPISFHKHLQISGKGLEDLYIWSPVAPPGFVCLGYVATRTEDFPSPSMVRCVHTDLVMQVNLSKRPLWNYIGSRGNDSCSLWRVENQLNTFIARSDLKRPLGKIAYGLAETGKPKPRGNLSAELRMKRLSVSILDDLSGMMIPVLDTTVSGVNLAAHGRAEALNVVAVCSMAASTFNTKLEAWEPLIEPFEGIVKYEYNDVNSETALKVGRGVRITAANMVNMNFTCAGIEALVGALLAWKKKSEVEEQAQIAIQMEEIDYKDSIGHAYGAALEHDDLEKMIIYNNLYNDLFLRMFGNDYEKVELLSSGKSSIVDLPPLKYPIELTGPVEKQPIFHFVVVHICDATNLALKKDIYNQELFCALRMVNSKVSSEDQKALLQSARSRAVKPSITAEKNDTIEASAKWNEAFIFEVPLQGQSTLEIVVTNLLAKGVKGEAVGTLSVPIRKEHGQRISHSSSHWKLLFQSINQGATSSWPTAQTQVFSLNCPTKQGISGEHESCSCGEVTAQIFYFTTGANYHATNETGNNGFHIKDLALWFGLTHDGPWEGLRSIVSQGVIPKVVSGQKIAVEVTIDQGRKHVSFRSLATIRNNTDMALEVCVCPASLLNYHDESASRSASKAAVFIEECFENQRYQPLAGWGSKWPGHLMPTDPGRWSNRDYSIFSQDFLEVPLPPGWIWTSDWSVDKVGNVDNEGWFYGSDFQSLRWPPESTKASRKSTFDFARRRRWVRTRQRVPEDKYARTRKNLGVLQPSSVLSLPLASTGAETDSCVQVRPYVSTSEDGYLWGRPISNPKLSSSIHGPDTGQSSVSKSSQFTRSAVPVSAFMLNQLEKKDELLLCVAANMRNRKEHCWLNLEADAVILHTELNEAAYDWKLSVNAPLRLENLLPCNAEYIVWEKTSGANPVKRQHGIVSAGGIIHIYSVDMRKPIYLTWLAQGSWKLQKEAVVISDPALEELPLHFWMQHQQSGRRLRVSLESDYGSTNFAAKTLRLFVPYWVCNDANLPLAFRLVEIEPTGTVAADSSWLPRAAKVTKQTSYQPSQAWKSGKLSLHKVIKTLDTIEDSYATPIMLSLHSELERLGSASQPHADLGNFMSRLGLSVAISNSNVFSHGLCFRDFEDSTDRMDMKAIDAHGGYYRLSAQLDMTSERTKVVHIQPHTLFINRLGKRLQLRQGDCRHEELLYPNDPPKTILWCSTQEPELLKITAEDYRWSQPFSIESEGVMHVTVWSEFGNSRFTIRVEVRNGMKASRVLVIFREVSANGPYRIENRSAVLPFRVRQVGSSYESWQQLQSGSALSFAWEDLQRDRLLEILVDGADRLASCIYNIDEIADHQPMPTKGGPVAALHVTVIRERGMQVVRVADWMPSDDILAIIPFGFPPLFSTRTSDKSSPHLPEGSSGDDSENQFLTVIELAEFGVSVVDHTPEELLYISLQNFVLSYATGLGSQTSRFKIRVDGLQVDNQLPLTPMPVLFTSKDPANKTEFVLKCTVTMKNQGVLDHYTYPYIGIQGPSTPNVCFLINIHEPIIWRLHDMFQNLNLSRLTSSQTTAVALDPIIYIGLLSTTEIRFKVTLAMSPTQRPRGILGFWSTLLTSLGNTDDMQIRITPHVHEEISMRQSALIAAAIASIRNDILSQPLRLLSGVDLLGNASSALGHMSKGIAALSMDKKFIRSRQKQESKANVDHLGDGIREGGEALAKSLFRGVTGIVTKPFEGARSSGVEGFIQGVGKGVIGAAVQPMSGILDLLSKTTEGANATRMKLAAVLTSEEQLLRRRLPRVIGGDNVLRPYDEYKAQGQVLLQLAYRGAIFGPMDFFKIRGKFAWSDAYEDHFHLPKGRACIVTHRRVLLLQHPTGIIVQKKPDLLKDACTILWDVTWSDLLSMELIPGKKDPPHSPPSRLFIYLRNSLQDSKLFDSRENFRIVKCHPGSKQAFEVRSSVQQAYDSYGPNRTRAAAQERYKSVTKPYAGVITRATSKAFTDPTMSKAENSSIEFSKQHFLEKGVKMETLPSMAPSEKTNSSIHSVKPFSMEKQSPSVRGRFISTCELIWCNKGAVWSKNFPVSIWRPISPSGYASVGDMIQSCYDPPDTARVYCDDYEGRLVLPEGFDLVFSGSENGSKDPLTIWMPRPPAGYVAMGCVAVPDFYEPDPDVIRCVHHDCVIRTSLTQLAPSNNLSPVSWLCRIWKVNNESSSFLTQREREPPPENLAFTIL